MELLKPVNALFYQIENLLSQLTQKEYSQKCNLLFNATIGQHIRHIIEWFEELEIGYEIEIVNYDNRKRNLRLETDIEFALKSFKSLLEKIDKSDKMLLLVANYDKDNEKELKVSTTYYREVLGNIEHAVHHMAIIKVGMSKFSNIKLPKDFGIAISTLKNESKKCIEN